ncbi:cryptochrome/photolyase family protein [Holophaga foetida]|uniref:cryptochrome/photolyase family protein n=1 Tax=Holophaga foetida TaxID=35839 RepID=UPI00024753B3|nr:deoxyribodipyrimidine photo-lyase [Holophaga foetida]
MSDTAALVWFRRDLRVKDHAALHHALGRYGQVHCVFVFDAPILNALPSKEDRRVEFILGSVRELDRELAQPSGRSGLLVRHGDAREIIPRLALELGVREVVCARDYEPEAVRRDETVARALEGLGIAFTALRDQVIFEADEILTGAGRMFSVFTPYRNAWMRTLGPHRLAPFSVEGLERLAPKPPGERIPELEELGFRKTDLALRAGTRGARVFWEGFQEKIDNYKSNRDFPAIDGGSRLSVHLRFGTISIRELVRFALERGTEGAQAWLNELIWREFYQQLLWHRPEVESHAFRSGYDLIPWEEGLEAEARFQAWCEGRTGYPLVDAAMRQLLSTGWMHNRLRMVTASFLTKDLGIHWLRGERFFARHLLDFDLAANNGGWQWAASTGCDAQPWFRIFNPVTQSRNFDPEGEFIRRYCPELEEVSAKQIHAPWAVEGVDYPPPIVDHALERQRTLQRFKGLGG